MRQPGITEQADVISRPSDAMTPRSPGCSIFYGYEEYTVPVAYRGLLEAHAEYLKSDRNARVRVVGNADERGSREYNLALAQRRAEAVKSLLVDLGARETQVVARSNGEEQPHRNGHDPAAWAGNRRSDLVYTRHKLPLPHACGGSG